MLNIVVVYGVVCGVIQSLLFVRFSSDIILAAFCYRLFGSDLPVIRSTGVDHWGVALEPVQAASSILLLCPCKLCTHAPNGLSKRTALENYTERDRLTMLSRCSMVHPRRSIVDLTVDGEKIGGGGHLCAPRGWARDRSGGPNKRRGVVGGVPTKSMETQYSLCHNCLSGGLLVMLMISAPAFLVGLVAGVFPHNTFESRLPSRWRCQ